ncbi:hypothetical protein PENARI_c196G06424 [Penicillium arizonense]|uniref:RNase H type-1 domain-containing protein n=1 Tax=Penicillium arizonense TaxID=1835702 RepID=A0A1F5L0J1_PENAI|nr:hypothetical protein PENARI_c196G06424 [Penicillium arizonense]OGE46547.1 hypothetical protein PENARI_c196G06424 [Penicillium arizonense]
MPLRNYGVWKANPVSYVVEHEADDDKSPHLSLYFSDKGGLSHHSGHKFRRAGRGNKEIAGLFRAAINIKSGDKDESRLTYWVDHDFNNHPIVNSLTDLSSGFYPLEETESTPAGVRLDYIRSNLFNVNTGRILPHDEPGSNNDMIDVLEPEVKQAIDHKADIYLFGEPFSDRKGIHNVHMNQGNVKRFAHDDGVFQDGGLLINYPRSGRWVGVFLGFASQAVHTDDKTGHAISSETWGDYMGTKERDAEMTEDSVTIDEALINPELDGPRARRRSVTLTNPKDHTMPLSSWKIKNSAGEFQALPRDAALGAKSTQAFDIPDVHLSNLGDTITLLNEQGLKVDGLVRDIEVLSKLLHVFWPRLLPPWRAESFANIEIGSDRETTRERAEAVRSTSDIVGYSDASGREGHLGAAVIALDNNLEVIESQQVQAAIEVQAAGTALRLQWVPGHCDNLGNDAADRLAKDAAGRGKTHPFRSLFTRETAFIRGKTLRQWEQEWKSYL